MMAEVMAAPIQLDGYYSSSPRCGSPQPPYRSSPTYGSSLPRSQYHSHFDTHKLSPPPSSIASSSPPLSSISYSAHSSVTSSVASSICLDTKSFLDVDDQLLFPVYDQGTGSSSSDSDTPSSPSISDYSTPPVAPRHPSPLTIEIPDVVVIPADDSVVRHEPSRHVDYLSHDWKEEDIWASWRYMIGKRKVYSNAARLENASWRTWAKSKFKLRTVSPETLNWLKDCDVTWLYGPLSTGNQRSLMVSPPSPTASPTESRLRSSGSFLVKKPILKKRSMSEVMLQKSLSNSSLLKQAAAAIESQQSGLSRPAMVSRANSDFSAFLQDSKSTSAVNTSDLPSTLSTGSQSPSCAKHIHFNDQVQQCIAVDKDEEDEDEDDVFQVENVEDSSSDDDGLVMMPKSKGCSKHSSRGCISDHHTIAMLPSTTLKAVEEVVEVKKNDTFSNIGSFFSSFGSGASSAEAKETEKTNSLATIGTRSYILEDDDDDMAELDWEPSHSSFATRRDSMAVTQERFGARSFESAPAPKDEDFQLPNYSNDEDEDDEIAAGLFGRAVDAVNTARDIAHVLWNVGWSR